MFKRYKQNCCDSVEATFLSLWAVLLGPAGSPYINHEFFTCVDILSDQKVSDVLLWPLVAVLELWFEITVIPWEIELDLFFWCPFENLLDPWLAVREDLSPTRFPPKAALTVVTGLIVGRILDMYVSGVNSIPHVVTTGPQVDFGLASPWRVVRLAD